LTRYLFVSPSLPDAAQLAGDGIVLRPPVEAGDLPRLPVGPGDVVAIADGYFHQTRSVRHKEILDLLDAGATVLGAASMGALRAAELDTLGMRGIGRVYRAYRRGELTADDEVALVHGPADEGYPALSEPLVNIRATLELAVRDGILDAATAAGFVTALARRPYRLRTYPDVLHLARRDGLPDATVERLRDLFATRPVNRKREDALWLLAALQRIDPTPRPRTDREPTVYQHRWQLGAGTVDTPDGPVAEMSVLRACQLFARDYPAFHRDLVFASLASECAADCGPLAATDPLDAALAHAVHRGVVPDQDALEPGDLDYLDPWLTESERDTAPVRDRLAAFLVRSHRIAPGIPADAMALDRIRPLPAAAAAQMNAQIRGGFDIHSLSADRILAHLAERWGADLTDLERHALDRGIPSIDVLVAAARPYHLLAKYNPDLVDLRMNPERRQGNSGR
jgi:hypothetical protein